MSTRCQTKVQPCQSTKLVLAGGVSFLTGIGLLQVSSLGDGFAEAKPLKKLFWLLGLKILKAHGLDSGMLMP